MFEQIIELLNQIANDRTVPRNIRNKCEESINILKDENIYVQLVKSFGYEFHKSLLLTGSILLNYSAVCYRLV